MTSPFVTAGPKMPLPVSVPAIPEPAPAPTPSFSLAPSSPLVLPSPGARRRPPPAEPGGSHLRMMLKAAAAIFIFGLIVFLKPDRIAENWFGRDEETLVITGPPVSALPAAPAKVIESPSLREHFNFTPLEMREFPDLNFKFRMPEGAWEFARDPWSREGSVFSLNKIPGLPGKEEIGEASFALRVLPLGSAIASDQNRATAAVQASLKALGGGGKITGREEVTLGTLLFSRIEVEDIQCEHQSVNAEVWLYALNGMVYEMITTMPVLTPPYYLSTTARRLAGGFSIADPSHVLRSADVVAMLETAGAMPVPKTAVTFGNVSITLKPDIWTTWPGAADILPGSTLTFASRGGLRMAAAFTPNEGLPDDPVRTASLIGAIWPALRDFQWSRTDRRPHQEQRTAVMRGTGQLNNRKGVAEVRAVRCGDSLMVLFAFGPGDTRPEILTAHLDTFLVDPGANQSADFGHIEARGFQRSALTGLAGDATANGRHEEASAAHLVLFEWDRRPDDLCNAARSLYASGKKDEAVQLITDREGRHAGQPEWEVQKMLLLASIAQPGESRRIAGTLLESGVLPASAAAIFIETLIEVRALSDAQSFVKLLTEKDRSPLWHLYSALLMAETGDRGKAAALVRTVRTAAPDDVELAVECVNVLIRCRLFPEALELARFLAAKNPQREQLQFLAAACHTALGHTAEAREAYQKILTSNPASTTARDALASLAASSGQEGSEEIVTVSIPPVPLPAALAAKLPRPHAPLADAGGQSVVHLYRVTGLQLHTSEPLRQTTRGAIRILDEEGMSLFNTMHFPVQPLAQRLCIHYLRVLDATGQVTAEAKLQDHYSLDGGGAGSGKVIHVPIPGLTPGCTIDYAWTIENAGTSGAIDYTRHVFGLAEPCRLDSWFITGDTSALKFATTRSLQPERDGDSLVWIETRPVEFTNSLLLSGGAEPLPILHAGTPSSSWEKLGRDYLDQIRDRLATNPAVTTAAHDTIAGLRTREERIAALSMLVRDSISYTAIEFGSRAVIPNPAAATLANRYGDCKDQAVLLHQLLTAAAIPSNLCVINSRGDIHKDFPCLAQFDHMIVALPSADGKTNDFIDPSYKYLSPVAGFAPSGLESRTALILDRITPRLAVTPAHTTPSDTLLKRDITLSDNADAVLRDAITFTGTRAARLRAALAPLPPLDRIAAVRSLIGFDRLSHHVSDIRIQNIKELQSPLRITIQWEARRAVRKDQGQVLLTLPTVIESQLLNSGDGDDDGSDALPLLLTSAVHLRTEATLHMPPGHTLAPRAPAGSDAAFGKWSLALSPPDASRAALLTWDCILLPATYAPEPKRQLIDFTHDALRQLQGEWEFTAESVAGP